MTCRGLFQSAPPAGAVQLVSAAELEALRARPGAVWYQNPLFPDETEAVWLPGEARYYRGPDTPLPELSDVFSLLAQAKALHDELEAVYNPHVDFARVYALGARARAAAAGVSVRCDRSKKIQLYLRGKCSKIY